MFSRMAAVGLEVIGGGLVWVTVHQGTSGNPLGPLLPKMTYMEIGANRLQTSVDIIYFGAVTFEP